MCGVFGYFGGQQNAGEIVFEGLKRLEYRGYDSWGVVTKVSDSLVVEKKTGKIGTAKLNGTSIGSLSLGHTRWATHGGVTDQNAHPHLDCAGEVAVVHNGIIENYSLLKEDLLKSGHKFVSGTDSEVAAHLIEQGLHKGQSPIKAIKDTIGKLKGYNALVVLIKNHPGFFAYSHGSPLVVAKAADAWLVASDASALLPHSQKLYFLDQGDFIAVNGDEASLSRLDTENLSPVPIKKVDWSFFEAEKGQWPHFMLKEIHEQAEVIPAIFGDPAKLNLVTPLLQSCSRLYLVGCGTAYHAALAGSYFLNQVLDIPVQAVVGSEFSGLSGKAKKGDLMLSLSQSGETMDTLEAVRHFKDNKLPVVAMVNALGSTLDRLADATLPLSAGPEIAVASTKAFTAKLSLLLSLAVALDLSAKTKLPLSGKIKRSVKAVLNETVQKQLKTIAKGLASNNHLYVIGRDSLYPVALEIALKIKEISYIHAEGMAGGELKHGTIALIETGTPVIVLAGTGHGRESALSSAAELKARGAKVIGISPLTDPVFDEWVNVDDLGDATGILMAIAGQLLAYYLTLDKGYDPDKPRNLAKSVTVK